MVKDFGAIVIRDASLYRLVTMLLGVRAAFGAVSCGISRGVSPRDAPEGGACPSSRAFCIFLTDIMPAIP